MNCRFGNPLSEDQLLIEDDPEILDHLRQCPFCAARLHELQQFELHLLDRLHPDSQLLLDFSFGLLAKGETNFIQEHLQTCASCQVIMAEFESYKVEASPVSQSRAPIRVQRLKPGTMLRELIAQFIPQSRTALATLGTSEDSFVAEAGGVQLYLRVQRSGDSFSLAGQVVDNKTESWEGAVAVLSPIASDSQSEAPFSTLLDDLSQFSYDHISGGNYKLRIVHLNGVAVTLYDLNFT
jgi:hypothetical protein